MTKTKLNKKNNENTINDINYKQILRQNEIITSLLGRIAFSQDKIRDIVIYKKKNREKYIDGYNACDGKHTSGQIASVIGVKLGTLSPILQEWEEKGIIYVMEKSGGKFYKHLFHLSKSQRQGNG